MFTINTEMLVTSMLRRMKQCAGLHLHSRITMSCVAAIGAFKVRLFLRFLGVFASIENAFRQLFEPAFEVVI